MNFIKKNYKWLLLLLFLLLGYGVYTLYIQNQQLKSDRDRLLHNLEVGEQTILEKENRAKELVYQVEAYRFRASELERTNLEFSSRLKEFSKKLDDIESYTKIHTKTSGSVKVPLEDYVQEETTVKGEDEGLEEVVTPVNPAKKFSHFDKYLEIEGLVEPDSVTIDYTYTSEIEVVYRWGEREGWFKPKKLIVEAFPTNDKEQVVVLQALHIEPEKLKWYQTTGFKIGTGVVIGVSLAAGTLLLVN